MVPPTAQWHETVKKTEYSRTAVVIIGAGISGLCTAINLLKGNIHNFVIIEKSSNLGGTWWDNRYPGCACDVFSHLYSFSFEQNPSWSHLYSGQEEILKYLIGVAEKYDLYKYIRFNSAIEASSWDEVSKTWNSKVKVLGGKEVEFHDKYDITSDFLVSAVGQLNQPHYPEIPGLENFKGKAMHSARWDWSYNFEGKRIGIIGTGATAAQIIPEVVKDAAHLTVFQRTPNWVIPMLDTEIPGYIKVLYKVIPPVLWRVRADMMDYRERFFSAVTDPDSEYEKLLETACTDMMKEQLKHKPELWESLTPEYPVGCKRVIISDDFYTAIGRENCTLEGRHIRCFSEHGVVLEDGSELEFDLIICATGFKTVDFMNPIKVTGSGGRDLSTIWQGGARALYGVTVESLPNFGMLYGPNTNLGHNSIILMIEAQARYIHTLIDAVMRARLQGSQLTIEPRPDRVEQFNAELQKALNASSFASPNCQSWYKTAEGLVTNNWSRTVVEYQKILSEVYWGDYVVSQNSVLDISTRKVIGRVVEETYLSYKALGLTTACLLAMTGGLLYGSRRRLVRAR